MTELGALRNSWHLYVHGIRRSWLAGRRLPEGSAASGGMWREHMARLRGYHCLAADLPGFGRSNRVRWCSRIETADLIAELIETRIPSRKAHLVGLSWGGSVSHALLARRADLLDRVIIDGCGGLPWWGNGLMLAGIAALSPFLHTAPVVAAISGMVGGMDEAGKADIRTASRRAFLRSFVEGFSVRITRAEIAAQCPTLFVAGEHEFVRPSNAAIEARCQTPSRPSFQRRATAGWV